MTVQAEVEAALDQVVAGCVTEFEKLWSAFEFGFLTSTQIWIDAVGVSSLSNTNDISDQTGILTNSISEKFLSRSDI